MTDDKNFLEGYKKLSEATMDPQMDRRIWNRIESELSQQIVPLKSPRRWKSTIGSLIAACVAVAVVVGGTYMLNHSESTTTASDTPSQPQNTESNRQLQSVSYTTNQLHTVESVANNVGITPYLLINNFTPTLRNVEAVTRQRVLIVDYGNVKLYEGASLSAVKTAMTSPQSASFAEGNQVNLSGGLIGQWMKYTLSGQSVMVLIVRIGSEYVAIVPSALTPQSFLPTPIQIGTMAQSLVDATAYSPTSTSKMSQQDDGLVVWNPTSSEIHQINTVLLGSQFNSFYLPYKVASGDVFESSYRTGSTVDMKFKKMVIIESSKPFVPNGKVIKTQTVSLQNFINPIKLYTMSDNSVSVEMHRFTCYVLISTPSLPLSETESILSQMTPLNG